ncbi:quinone oxidoreductase family protein [Gordonia rubripertincta]|uniref:Quinone oxidoreductase n=1 Tax=Gordonia rubripertincta TaxID=36822 RepID=A0ABT4MUX4_GORRU|nr:quinone oxidoreductase [Gordonia rubripertincta]MCZ4550599.1 quinone oxidoreductase [Gordonia rubripertincta]
MHAIKVSQHGGPDELQYVSVPDPEPGAGEILVRVAATGVNFIDTYQRSGAYAMNLPYVPGSEGAGEVIAVGPEVTTLTVGQRVAWCDAPGSYADLVVVRAARAIPVPDDVDDQVAASALLQGLTAHYLLDGSAHPRTGETILVHAGAGGVGLVLTQMAKAKGLRVITTVSSDAKETLSREAGADEVLRYGDDLADRVRALTDDRGVAVSYDGVGADTFEQSLTATAVRGFVVLFGAASGPVPPFDLQRLNAAGSLSVTRPKLGDFIADDEEFTWRAGDVISGIANGTVKVLVGHTYPLADAAQAHRDLAARSTTGSLVLLPGPH